MSCGRAAGVASAGAGAATWAGTRDSPGGPAPRHVVRRIASQYVLALAASPDGSLWAAHLRGLARSADGGRTWSEFPAPSPCDPARCTNRIRALASDSAGVWVGTERGLFRFDPARGLWVDRRGGAHRGPGAVIQKSRPATPPPPPPGRPPHRAGGAPPPGGGGRPPYPPPRCGSVQDATAGP